MGEEVLYLRSLIQSIVKTARYDVVALCEMLSPKNALDEAMLLRIIDALEAFCEEGFIYAMDIEKNKSLGYLQARRADLKFDGKINVLLRIQQFISRWR